MEPEKVIARVRGPDGACDVDCRYDGHTGTVEYDDRTLHFDLGSSAKCPEGLLRAKAARLIKQLAGDVQAHADATPEA